MIAIWGGETYETTSLLGRSECWRCVLLYLTLHLGHALAAEEPIKSAQLMTGEAGNPGRRMTEQSVLLSMTSMNRHKGFSKIECC